MHTNGQQTLTRPMCTSRLAFSFCRTAKHQLACLIRAALRSRKMFIPKLTSLRPFMGPPRRNGVLHSLNSPLKDLLRRHWELQNGIVLWRRFATQVSRPSS